MGASSAKSIWSTTYVLLILISFFQSMGQNMMNTLVPLYTYQLGATAQVVGVVAGSFAVTALLMRPFVGPAFDSFSKKKLLMCSIGIITAATFFYSISGSIPALIATRLLHGVGMAVAVPITMTIVSETLPEEKLSSGISIYTLAFALSQCIGPFLGLWMAGEIGFEWTFRTTTASMVVAFLLAAALREKPNDQRKPYQLRLSRMISKKAIVPATIIGMLSISFSCIGSFIVIYGHLRGVSDIGICFTVYAVFLLATRPFYGKLADRIGVLCVIPIGLVSFAISLFVLGFSDSLVCFVVAAITGACGFGAVLPLLQSLSFACSPRCERGAASNTNCIGLDIGNLLGPVFGGAIVGQLCSAGLEEALAFSGMYLLSIIPIVISFGILFVNRKKLLESIMAAKL